MTDHSVDWEPCTQVDCIGVPLSTGERCWAHAAVPDMDAALKRLGENGQLDARGVPITAELLERLLAAAPHDDRGHAVLTDARFNKATFHSDARFLSVTFAGDTWFIEATFEGDAMLDEAAFQGDVGFRGADFQRYTGFRRAAFQGYAGFERATFHADARFDHATFAGDTRFTEATFEADAVFNKATLRDNARFGDAAFQGDARFEEATFQGPALFDRVTFERIAWFLEATFEGDAQFDGATLQGDAQFNNVTFRRDAGFGGVTFQRGAWFPEAAFEGDARFDGATFQQAWQLGPMLVRKSLVIDQAIFHERVQVEVAAAAVCCQRTRFLAGVQLRVRWARVTLEDADLAAPSILTGTPDSFSGLDEGDWTPALVPLQARASAGRPRLVSVCRADVAGLTVAGVDLRACRFAGAHHLDQLRLDESDFAATPKGWRWTPRQTIAEEHQWRSKQGPVRAKGWYPRLYRPPAWLKVEPLTPGQIAGLYRALRKGREDNKDEPGAADFYYGEMEMRRHDSTKPTAERFVLVLHWLFSGYALRASRALTWLLGVLAVATLLLAAQGLKQPAAGWSFPARLGTAALVAVEGAVFRASEQQLTYVGRLIQAVLRFAGPILLGLAVLSTRGRVKR